jgi:hypothetical protein
VAANTMVGGIPARPMRDLEEGNSGELALARLRAGTQGNSREEGR